MRLGRSPVRGCCAAVLIGSVLVAPGCGAENGDAPVTTSGVLITPRDPNTLSYGSVGTTAELDCADGKSLSVGGSNNRLTVHGRCATVRVGGSDNTIAIDKVDGELAMVGFNNTVTYRTGEPVVSDSGSNNTVKKG